MPRDMRRNLEALTRVAGVGAMTASAPSSQAAFVQHFRVWDRHRQSNASFTAPSIDVLAGDGKSCKALAAQGLNVSHLLTAGLCEEHAKFLQHELCVAYVCVCELVVRACLFWFVCCLSVCLFVFFVCFVCLFCLFCLFVLLVGLFVGWFCLFMCLFVFGSSLCFSAPFSLSFLLCVHVVRSHVCETLASRRPPRCLLRRTARLYALCLTRPTNARVRTACAYTLVTHTH